MMHVYRYVKLAHDDIIMRVASISDYIIMRSDYIIMRFDYVIMRFDYVIMRVTWISVSDAICVICFYVYVYVCHVIYVYICVYVSMYVHI
jgi:hypothetical protein